MSLEDSGRAIGEVTRLLQSRTLAALAGLTTPQIAIDDVTIGRPEPPQGANPRRRLNFFLYDVEIDGHLRNVSLDDGQPPPLWLVLRYLLTAFDRTGESDTIEAHQILGEGMRVLQDLNFFAMTGLPGTTVAALNNNPDRLKLTFEDASLDLMTKLTQGSEGRYRCSVAFQVRPVLIALGTPPAYSFLVGIDYQQPAVIGEEGIRVPVLPSLGPVLDALEPPTFGTGDTVAITGSDLHLSGLSVALGPVELPVASQHPGRLTFVVDPALEDGIRISANSQTVSVLQALPSGRKRRSNLLVGNLLPRLDAVAVANLTRVDNADPDSPVRGDITLTGILLGKNEDDVFAALYRDGRVVRMFDRFTRPAASPPQTVLEFSINTTTAVPPGAYNLILRVNGQQARNSPPLLLVVP
jgi:hypothetical protein